MRKRLDIVFFGEDSFSDIILNSLIEAGHNVNLVVTPYYDNNIYKRLALRCQKNGISLLRTQKVNSDETVAAVAAARPDLCCIAHFERLVKKPLLQIPRLGFINLHPSLLPDYRGMAPQHWPIINREKKTGLTIHYVDETADTGDIILQREIPLNEDMYVSDLQMKWREEYKTIMVEAIKRMLSGAPTICQKELQGRYYGKLKPEQCVVDLSGSVHDAYAMVRGLSMPYHGAVIGDKIVYRAHVERLGTPSNNAVDFKDGALVLDLFKDASSH